MLLLHLLLYQALNLIYLIQLGNPVLHVNTLLKLNFLQLFDEVPVHNVSVLRHWQLPSGDLILTE